MNLFRYFVKNFSCKIVKEEYKISREIKEFVLGKTSTLKHIKILLTIKEPIVKFVEMANEENQYYHLFDGPLTYYAHNGKIENGLDICYSFYDNQGLNINAIYSLKREMVDQNISNQLETIEIIKSKTHIPIKGIFTLSQVEYLENCDCIPPDKYKLGLINRMFEIR